MKTKKSINIAALALIVFGVIFKANHWPGANVAITLGVVTMLLSLIMFGFKENKEAGVKNGLNYILIGTLILFLVGLLFKIQHWPTAGVFVVCSYFMGFLLPLIMIIQKNDFKLSRQFSITFFTYFILLITMFPKNPINQYFQGGTKNVPNELISPIVHATTSLKKIHEITYPFYCINFKSFLFCRCMG